MSARVSILPYDERSPIHLTLRHLLFCSNGCRVLGGKIFEPFKQIWVWEEPQKIWTPIGSNGDENFGLNLAANGSYAFFLHQRP